MSKIVNNPSFTTDDGSQLDQTTTTKVEELGEENIEEVEKENGQEEENAEQADAEVKEAEVKTEAESEKIKIGEEEYSVEEAKEIVERGKKIKEWETKMPGFNIDTFMPDYTRKSQELAEYKRRSTPKTEKVDIKELEELGVDQSQIAAIEKVASHLGLVRQSDIVQNSVEAQKEAFIATHPEYKPGLMGSDEKWNKLMEEFSVYNWQNYPHKVADFLENAHSKVSQTWQEVNRGKEIKVNVTTQKAKADANAINAGKSKTFIAPKSENVNFDKYRAMGWSEEDIKEILT